MSLRNDLIKHQIFIQRLAATHTTEIKKFLDVVKNAAKLEIAAGTYGVQLKKILRESLSYLPEAMVQSLIDVVEYENKFTIKTLKKYTEQELITLDRQAAEELVLNRNMPINSREGGRSKSLTTTYSQFARRKADEIAQKISDGRVTGNTNSEISSAVDEVVAGLFYTQAYNLSVSSINYVVALAREASTTFEDVWITALDFRVCSYCEERHEVPTSEAGIPPAHWNCRCHIEPRLT